MASRVYGLALAAPIVGVALALSGCFYPAYEVVDGCLEEGSLVPIACGQANPTSIALSEDTIYWTNEASGEVMAMAKEAGSPAVVVPADGACGVAVGGGFIYWRTHGGQVKRKAIPEGTIELLVEGLGDSCAIGTDATGQTSFYFDYNAKPEPALIQRDKDGALPIATGKRPTALFVPTGVTAVWIDAEEGKSFATTKNLFNKKQLTGGSPCGVTIRGNSAFVTSSTENTVVRVDTSTLATKTLATEQAAPCQVAANIAGVYWLSDAEGTLTRQLLQPTSESTVLATGPKSPCSIAMDGQHVYWTSCGKDGKVMRAPL